MPNVEFVNDELGALLPKYQLIYDCLDGEEAVKKQTTRYLPKPAPADKSVENAERYDQYLLRAVFYNVTKRTLGGLVGLIFSKAPVVTLPTGLQEMVNNLSGTGMTFEQSAKRASGHTCAFGRIGLLTEYPKVEGVASKEDIRTKGIRPVIHMYKSSEIINWRSEKIGNEDVHKLIVIKEQYVDEEASDDFETQYKDQYRALRLIDGRYVVQIWREDRNIPYETLVPLDSRGQPLTRIPFEFVGSENNDSSPDAPPLYDMAVLNIAHFRNSADYEEACYITGQPTLWVSGLTAEWYKNQLNGKIEFGSRAGIALPTDGAIGLVQAEANTMPFEAMQHKERQMVALGAKLIQEASVQRTATEAGIENTSEMSVLSSIANNVSSAYTKAFKHAALFTGDDASKIEIKLNSDFDALNLSPDDIAKFLGAFNGQLISWSETRDLLRRAGFATLDDVKAKAEIIKDINDTAFNPPEEPAVGA